MPFESERQRRFLFANKPEVARKFARDTKRGRKRKGRKVLREMSRRR